ncbi:MAG: KpsF/GutQ family sugar-phosphate isomerase [Elusimicrobiales bacterium]|nr:KpsF/GutQ family sugar-phosphate isomerase [Elusimicrobiales bacterium]MCK5106374.1 KpsF/GutQ family sugar-phosphate isomerase [Elusimicrobiales bacterium]MCK5357151.1 KpsF/GutQ family sugar-phosphate isomerase [Elusimicrobiales bacterium]
MTKTKNLLNKKKLIANARKIMIEEAGAVIKTAKGLGPSFIKAITLFSKIKGKIIVIGIGKSGIISRKIAATLSSTGSPSVYLHPVECLHGDMGIVGKDDAVLMLSYSGETEETNKLLPFLKSKGLVIVAITKGLKSKLAKRSDITIALNINKEACPFNVVPTSSTAGMLALGDAIAITLMQLKGFNSSHFARLHPGGQLGKLLNIEIKDLMHKGKNNPVINENQTIKKALAIMTQTQAGAVSIVNSKGKLTGFFTDGDLRRLLQKNKPDLNLKIKAVMTKKPTTVFPDTKAIDVAQIITAKKIDNMPVIDRTTLKPIGIIDERDLLNEGLL